MILLLYCTIGLKKKNMNTLALQLSKLRNQLSSIDESIIALIAQRQKKILEIGKIKRALGEAVYAPEQEKIQYHHYEELAKQEHLDTKLIHAVFDLLINDSKKQQS